MLAYDHSKAQHLNHNTGAPFAMLRGLGLNVQEMNQFNPEPISRAAIDVIAQITDFLGIGAGRREADEIVPTQNYIHYNVLAPIAEAVNASYAPNISRSQLEEMLQALRMTEENWLRFLHDTQWSDGRAAVQAEATLEFLFEDQERKILALMPDAPYFSNVEPPVYTPYTPGGGSTPGTGYVQRPPYLSTGFGPGSFGSGSTPLILGAVALFALMSYGKRSKGGN